MLLILFVFSNCVEWTTIEEENERLPLLDKQHFLTANFNDNGCTKQGISPAVSTGMKIKAFY